MSTITHSAIQTCPNCGAQLPLEAQACPSCHALVYSVRLDQLSHDARALENRGLFPQARELWATSLTLLPPGSSQAAWIGNRILALQQAEMQGQNQADPATAFSPSIQNQQAAKPAPRANPNWVKKLGPFGPAALFLLKFKSALFLLFKLKFLFSFGIFVWLYITLFGWRFGLGFSVCILIHEMGHYVDVRRRGLPAEMPIFLPGFGAYVRWTGLGVTSRQIAQIALAGPLAGWIASAVCYLIYAQTQDPIWAALARTGAWLNILNLIPVWFFDGGLASRALGVAERVSLLVLTIGLWYVTREGVFLLVALGAAWSVFVALSRREAVPQQPDWSTWTYYASLLTALAVIVHFAPNALANQGMQNGRIF